MTGKVFRSILEVLTRSTLAPLVLGSISSLFFPMAEVQTYLKWSSVSIFGLFLFVGLKLKPSEIRKDTRVFISIFFWSTVLPWAALFAACYLLHFAFADIFLISSVLLTTGAGVTVHTLMRYQMVHTKVGQLLALLSSFDDVPAALLLAFSLSYFSSGAVQVSTSLGLASIFIGLILGATISFLSPKVSQEVQSPLQTLLKWILPVYFFSVGIKLSPSALSDSQAYGVVTVLLVVSCLGKWLPTFVILKKRKDPELSPAIVSWGLVPRGIPGLAFASLAYESQLINQHLFTILILVVALSTWVGLLGLGQAIRHFPMTRPQS